MENNLNQSKRQLDKKLKELKKQKDEISFKSKKKEIEMELENYTEFTDLFEIELTEATPTELETYMPRFEEYQGYAFHVEAELKDTEQKLQKKWKAKKHAHEDSDTNKIQMQTGSGPKKMEQMTAEELNEDINKKLDDADIDLDEIIRILTKTRNLGNEINKEILVQQEKLDMIRDQVNECYSLSKRSAKLLNYFKKNFMTDKIICVFIILICIAIIVIIGLRIAGYQTDSFDPSVVPNQPAATAETTTAG